MNLDCYKWKRFQNHFTRKTLFNVLRENSLHYWENWLAEIPNVVSNDDMLMIYVDIEYFVNNLAMLNYVDGRKNIDI